MNALKGLVGSEDMDITGIEKLQLRNKSFMHLQKQDTI